LLPYLISGITLGTAAGLSPGPLLALLVAQTLRYGPGEGIRVALAPLLTDLPIVIAALFLISRLSDTSYLLAAISIAGGLYLVWLGIESLRVRGLPIAAREASPLSVRKAMTVNFLNPHVYIFWAGVGGPLVVEGSNIGASAPAAFLASFYLCLCGSKVLIAVLLGRSRGVLGGAAYLWTIRALGVALACFGIWLIWRGVDTAHLVQ